MKYQTYCKKQQNKDHFIRAEAGVYNGYFIIKKGQDSVDSTGTSACIACKWHASHEQ